MFHLKINAMKKLLFLLTGALVAFTASAQTSVAPEQAVGKTAISSGTVIVRAGFCPETYQGDLCGIFVTIEKEQTTGRIVRLVDPQPHVFRTGSDWVEITDQVLISYDVRYDMEDEIDFGKGVLHCSFTYQYPGGEVQNFSIAIDTYPGGEPL